MITGRFVTRPTAVRVFCGYRHPRLNELEFRHELGETFMPGTPYMLQPLGLHAYAAAVFDEDTVRDTPHETGLIAYASQSAYRTIRAMNLRGRLYTHTHAAVYAEYNRDGTRRSSAEWAEPLTDGVDDSPRTVHLLDEPSDLQRGTLTIHLGVPTDPKRAGALFRRDVRAALPALRDALRQQGFAQGFVTLRDNYYVAWLHREDDVRADPIDDWLQQSTRLAKLETKRVLFLEDHPLVVIDGPSAFSFVFLRSPQAELT